MPNLPNTASAPVSSRIVRGRITEVDAARWLCSVRPESGDSDVQVSIPSLYSHPIGGEGIHYLPEVGAVCYICFPSDNARRTDPFLLLGGAATIPKDRSESGGAPGSMDMFRPIMSPGDIALLTRDGNGLVLRRGGVTELRGTSLAKVLFNPMKNQILTIAENYKVQTFGGSLEWKNLLTELDPQGRIKTQYSLQAKEFATSKGMSVRLRLGATEEDPIALQPGDEGDTEVISYKTVTQTLSGDGSQYTIQIPVVESLNESARVVDFRVYQDETVEVDSLTESFTLGMDREGDLLVESDGVVHLSTTKWAQIKVPGGVPSAKADSKMFVTSGDMGTTQPVMKGSEFLTSLTQSLTEISGLLKAMGLATPLTDQFLSDAATSLTAGGPFLSSTLESD